MSSALNTTVVGKKRKRHTAVEKDPSAKLTGRLHHYFKEVNKAAKKSKAFEIQRLVKKLKDLRRPVHGHETAVEAIAELEAQLESLKRLNHERIAHLALSSKIRKDKLLSTNDALIAALPPATLPAYATPDAQHDKVECRLLSSRTLASKVQSTVSGLRAALEPDLTGTGDDLKFPDTDDSWNRLQDEEDGPAESDMRQSQEGSIQGGTSTGNAVIAVGMVVDGDNMVDDGWESGSVDDIEQPGSDDSSPPPRKRPKQLSPSLGRNESAAASTFLPSLSVGYLKGDSDSDLDRSEGETVATGRKNRRGQRARQAIWEKKYGKNAKHVKRQREEADAAITARMLGKRSDKGWAGRHRDGLSARSAQSQDARPKQPHAQNSSKGQPERVPPEKPTHPSWEAKKKLKEREGARILPSQGKKIVFA